jgi:acyl-CoA synthetase (AMP-forming)/AMP-acid ligase II
MNLSLILQMASETQPERIGLVCEGRRWSYGALYRAARLAAAIVAKSGCRHVGLLDESSEAAAIALFAAAIARIPYTPLNYRLADADLAALLDRIAPGYLIGDVERIERLSSGRGHAVFSRAAFLGVTEQMPDPVPTDEGEFDDEGVAVQLFTSGTTATPKAALLRHANLLSYVFGTVEFGSASLEQASLVSVPPYHIAGIAALLTSTYSLRRIVLLPAFEPDSWLALAAAERATNAFVVPTMLRRILERVEAGAKVDLSALAAIAYGGGPMPMEVIGHALEVFPWVAFTNAYGLTETSSTIALLGPEEHRAAQCSSDPVVRQRLRSVGKPMPTVRIEVRDDQGQKLPPGQRGEIYVRGDQVSGEYRERTTLDADGWFPTRDAGWLDEEGYLFVTGRADDVIVRGGENIAPEEIEDVLLTHPAIADAAAVAVPSVEWGEAVGVAIVPRPGHAPPPEEELRTMIRKRLRSSRVPERIAVLNELPYTSDTGKLLRREIRALLARTAGIHA